jgi:hypothetical protein
MCCLTGCSDAPSGEGTNVIPPEASIDESGRIIAACHGMKLVGMRYSPGGTALPNQCAPFDVRDNNPYAVRCIDAMPDFRTPFPGDEYCILPPPPGEGFQVGVHPGGNARYWEKMWAADYSFYDDPAVTAEYELLPGGEALQNYLVDFDVPGEERYYYRRYFRGRGGSHHGAASFTGVEVVEEGWQETGEVSPDRVGSDLVFAQDVHADIPQNTLEPSPEEEGLGIEITPDSDIQFNLHHFNTSDAPILRENWVNAWYVASEAVTRPVLGIHIDMPIDYPVGVELDNEGVARMNAETVVFSLWGHRHAWTTRFHAWVVRAGGDEELIYDSYDWQDMPTFAYNSVTQNPEPGKGIDGASSGPLVLHPGDELHFNCHVATTDERSVRLGVRVPEAPLKWDNRAFAGEMCLLMGQATGAALLGP